MNNFPEHITDTILARYFSGEATTQEKNEILEWSEISIENREELQKLKIIWADTGFALQSAEIEPSVNIDQAWQNVKVRKKANKRKPLYYALAASVVILIGLFFLSNPTQTKQETVLTGQSQDTVILPDGSQIFLNKKSQINYPKEFDGETRNVVLQGEAFFEIVPNPEKPFIIEIGEAKVEVMGTSFNIKTNDNLDSIEVSVVTGRVYFYNKYQKIALNSGQKGLYIKSKIILEKTTSLPSGLDHFWRTKSLIFDAAQLGEIIEILNLAYSADIQLANLAAHECRFTSIFNDETIDDVLEIISETLSLEVKKSNGSFTLVGRGCGD